MIALFLSLTLIVAQAVGATPPLPDAHRIAAVPRMERTATWCGPAALAAVLNYHGAHTSAKQIADAIYLPGFRGSLNLDLLIYARQHGYAVWAEEGSARKLQEAIARDRPAICLIRLKGALASTNHVVVVSGYDRPHGVWRIDSGMGKEETIGAADFDAEWAKCDRWMLVVEGKESGKGPQACAPR